MTILILQPTAPEPTKDIINQWSARMEVTLDGHKYVFEPGQKLDVTDPAHREVLLAMQKPATGCCGAKHEPFNYFAEV